MANYKYKWHRQKNAVLVECMRNKSITTFFKSNWAIIGNIIWPVVVSSVLFYADSRYLQKNEYKELSAQNQSAYRELAIEQKDALNKLTNAISALTEQSRQNSESVKVLLSQREDYIDRLNRHEINDGKLYDILSVRLATLERR